MHFPIKNIIILSNFAKMYLAIISLWNYNITVVLPCKV